MVYKNNTWGTTKDSCLTYSIKSMRNALWKYLLDYKKQYRDGIGFAFWKVNFKLFNTTCIRLFTRYMINLKIKSSWRITLHWSIVKIAGHMLNIRVKSPFMSIMNLYNWVRGKLIQDINQYITSTYQEYMYLEVKHNKDLSLLMSYNRRAACVILLYWKILELDIKQIIINQSIK